MNESTFEGSLFGKAITNVLHDPLMSRREYKSLSEHMEGMVGIESNFAELYRQILQGSNTDPGTLFRLKSRLIETHGPQAYDNMLLKSRGQIVFDGIASRQFSNNSGEGQLIGNIINPKSLNLNRAPVITLKGARNTNIRSLLDETIGAQNERNNLKKKDPNCEGG